MLPLNPTSTGWPVKTSRPVQVIKVLIYTQLYHNSLPPTRSNRGGKKLLKSDLYPELRVAFAGPDALKRKGRLTRCVVQMANLGGGGQGDRAAFLVFRVLFYAYRLM